MRIDFCVKRPVSAVITLKDGKTIIGGNYCTNAQDVCPRQAGEGYAKCFTTCGQIGHAEEVAIRLLRGAGLGKSEVERIDVYNHDRPCDACKRLLTAYGLLAVTKFHGLATPHALDEEQIRVIDKEYCLTLPGNHSSQAGSW